MFKSVSFEYDGIQIHEIFVAVYPVIINEVRYVVVGVPYNCTSPVIIGAAGVYKNVTSALEKVKAIAEKYPPKAIGVAGPEFTGI